MIVERRERLLLDTHVVIWLAVAPNKVPGRVRDAFATAALAVSVVSAWEHGVKRARRPDLDLPAWESMLDGLTVERLALDWTCAAYAETLPDLHRDPFDRMLIAQAHDGGWTLVTADRDIHRYSVSTLW